MLEDDPNKRTKQLPKEARETLNDTAATVLTPVGSTAEHLRGLEQPLLLAIGRTADQLQTTRAPSSLPSADGVRITHDLQKVRFDAKVQCTAWNIASPMLQGRVVCGWGPFSSDPDPFG